MRRGLTILSAALAMLGQCTGCCSGGSFQPRDEYVGCLPIYAPNLYGSVELFDATTGEPVSGATVSLARGEEEILQASEPGRYELVLDEGGTYTLRAQADGFFTSVKRIDVPIADECGFDLMDTPVFGVFLDPVF